jgi:hypothetical protein
VTARSARSQTILDELPPETVAVGCRHLEEANRTLAEVASERAVDCSAEAVAAHLVRPIELGDGWPDPTDPMPVGDGAVHADLIDDDRELLATLRSLSNHDPTAESLAAEAQSWRLPVTPYRRREHVDRPPETSAVSPCEHNRAKRRALTRRCRVVDLTALWAGPLATALLAEVGADVIKVDPAARPDALAEHPRLYDHLNREKDVVDLDLRVDDDRRRFEQLVRSADLVVDSFSRRVMPNLGYGPVELRALRPQVATLSIVAFDPNSPYADWVAYGPGVHAMSGLAETNRGADDARPRFRPAPIAYPDALAGMAAFASALDALAVEGPTAHRTVSLAGAIAPLHHVGRSRR